MLKIITFKYDNKLKRIPLSAHNIVSVGRFKKINTIGIDNPLISKTHLQIEYDGVNIFVKDLGSINGSFMNGHKLKANVKHLFTNSDTIRISKKEGVCSIRLSEQPGNPLNNQNFNSSSHKGIPAVNSKAASQGLAALLNSKDNVIIGRSNECDIVVNDAGVSRKHLKVYKFRGEYYVEDLGSTNGTFVNQHRIRSKTKLQLSDTIYVGLHAFSLNTVTRDLSKESAIQTIQLKKTFKNGKIGLQPININIQAKTMVALMGPSGCGKSTLLKSLNGDSPATSGQVYIFGLELIKNYELLKQKIGYVPQDDIVHLELTVDTTLYYAAKLRLADDASSSDIRERINEILVSLNLNDPVIRNTTIKNLSGGQRKRVSIAVELLNKPAILFLDEPTSSLDPETIEEFLKCLRNLCSQGTTVIMVTHKPEDLYFVDEIIFLGAKGFHVFSGPRNEMLPYFQRKNIIEVYSLLSNETNSKEWNHKINTGNDIKEISHKQGTLKKDNPISPLRQLFWLSARYLQIKLSNRNNLILLFMQPVIIAVLIKLSFGQLSEIINGANTGVMGAVFMMAITAIWFGVSNSAKEIISEKAIFRKERMNNLYLGNYFLSKWLVLTFISFFQLLLFLFTLKLSYGNELSNFSDSLLFLLLISNSSIILGLLLSATSASADGVMTILPVALLSQIILAGIITPLQSKVTEFLSFLTLGRWGTEGLARLQDTGTNSFLPGLKDRLYNDKVIGSFNSFSSNLGMVIMLSILMIILTISALKKMEKNSS
ncbi:MAG TPA: FHA domain-containing protein [Ferruginibacter sp.]|nr:FHA domain-containing protein [Ferruginibacter sp.]